MAVDDSYTVTLLHMDGSDASTTFTDESGKTWTAAGNAQIDTAQSKFGGASGLFDGTGDISTSDHADFDFPGDFTIDFWLRLNATGILIVLYDGRPTGTSGIYPTLYILNTDNKLYYLVDSTNRISGTTVLTTGAWYHVAIARSGTSTKMFLNGTQEGSTYSDSNSYINGTSRPIIGGNGFASGNSHNGWMDELRISKGIARWTTTFTPPTAPYAPFLPGVFVV